MKILFTLSIFIFSVNAFCLTHYETLGLDLKSSPEEIKKTYKELALKYHPDKNPLPSAGEKMKAINTAYEVLGNPQKKAAYDLQIGNTFLDPKHLNPNEINDTKPLFPFDLRTGALHIPFDPEHNGSNPPFLFDYGGTLYVLDPDKGEESGFAKHHYFSHPLMADIDYRRLNADLVLERHLGIRLWGLTWEQKDNAYNETLSRLQNSADPDSKKKIHDIKLAYHINQFYSDSRRQITYRTKTNDEKTSKSSLKNNRNQLHCLHLLSYIYI